MMLNFCVIVSSTKFIKVLLPTRTSFPAVSVNSLLAAEMMKTRQHLNMPDFSLKFSDSIRLLWRIEIS